MLTRNSEPGNQVLTFEALCEVEPRLRDLEREAKEVRDDNLEASFCANWVWYRRLKPELLTLVGFTAQNPELRSAAAYDLAYKAVYRCLPNCRGCVCV